MNISTDQDVDPGISALRGRIAFRTLWLGAQTLLGGAFNYPILLSVFLFTPESRNPDPDAARAEALGMGLVVSSVVLFVGVAAFLLLQLGVFRTIHRSTRGWVFWSAAAAAFVVGVVWVGPLLRSL